MVVVEEDYRYKMVSSISKVETNVTSIQESVDSLNARMTTVEKDCIRRSAVWSMAIILATALSGVIGSYWTSSSSQQKVLDEQARQQMAQEHQQTALQEQLQKLAETSEMNRKLIESWMKAHGKFN